MSRQSQPEQPTLSYCFFTKYLSTAKTLHAHLLVIGALFSLHPQIKLLLTYARCRDLLSTTNLFKSMDQTNPLSWNALISALSQHGFPTSALTTFSRMHKTGLRFDSYSFASALNASTAIKSLQFGKQIHARISKSGSDSSVFVGSALIDFYAKSMQIRDAYQVFDVIPMRNIVCLNSLLAGFVEEKRWENGLDLFRKMELLKLDPDRFTYSAILRVCTGLSAVKLGKQVHANVLKKVYGTDVFLQNSLVEMYAKCGFVEKARNIFDGAENQRRDLILWTSMISGYGKNGRFEQVIELFDQIQRQGIKPDSVVFLTVLSACSHAGLVEKGLSYFTSMVADYGIIPSQEHYACVVDLLCRAGELEKAWSFIHGIPCGGASVSMWGTLLCACREFGNVELGKLAAERAIELDPDNAGNYVVLSNLYASVGKWEEIVELRKLMNERGLKKDAGCSWIEITR